MPTLPVVAEWEPVSAGALEPWDGRHDRTEIEALAGDPAEIEALAGDRAEIEARARELGLQPVRWPSRWPPDTSTAMLAATYAKRVGRAVAFSLAAFRQEFAGGRDLGDRNTVLIAAAACEMHPTAVLKGIALRSVRDALRDAGGRAQRAGVRGLPAIQVGRRVYEGLGSVAEAAAALGADRD